MAPFSLLYCYVVVGPLSILPGFVSLSPDFIYYASHRTNTIEIRICKHRLFGEEYWTWENIKISCCKWTFYVPGKEWGAHQHFLHSSKCSWGLREDICAFKTAVPEMSAGNQCVNFQPNWKMAWGKSFLNDWSVNFGTNRMQLHQQANLLLLRQCFCLFCQFHPVH